MIGLRTYNEWYLKASASPDPMGNRAEKQRLQAELDQHKAAFLAGGGRIRCFDIAQRSDSADFNNQKSAPVKRKV